MAEGEKSPESPSHLAAPLKQTTEATQGDKSGEAQKSEEKIDEPAIVRFSQFTSTPIPPPPNPKRNITLLVIAAVIISGIFLISVYIAYLAGQSTAESKIKRSFEELPN